MSDFLDQYNTGSERVTQQEIKPTSAPQDAGTPNEAPRRRRSDRYAQEEPALFDTPNEAPRQPMQPAYVQRAPEAAAPQTEGPWVRQQADASFSGDRSSWNEPNDVRPSVRMEEDEDEYEDDEEEGGGAPILRLFLIVLALVVALAAVLYFAPIQEDSFLYPAKALVDDGMKKVKALVNPVKDPAAQIVSFDCLQSSGTVGTRLMMTLVTTDAVQEVSLSTREGVDLKATVNALDNPVEGQKKWSVSKQFTEPFEGPVYAQVLVNGQWGTNNAKFVSLLVVQPTATPEPTQAPTKAPTQPPVLTPEPTAEPTAAPTAEPTEAPTAKPTAEPTDTSSLSALNQTEQQGTQVTDEPVVLSTWATFMATELPTQPPTEAPTQEPTQPPPPTEVPTQAPTETPAPTAEPTATPKPTSIPVPALTAESGGSSLRMDDSYFKGGKEQKDFSRERGYMAPHPDQYSFYSDEYVGVITFRGDNFRRNAAYGRVNVQEETMTLLWKSPIGSLRTADNGVLYGVGWTGQPAIVQWTKQVREGSEAIKSEFRSVKAFKEVIFAAQDGKVYFLDLKTGTASREPINIGYPLKGSVSLDASGRPLMAFGQGISKLTKDKTGPIGVYLYDLMNNKQLTFINGRQSDNQKQYTTNGACDGTPLFLYEGETTSANAMIVASENGLLYTVDLDINFKYPDATNPDIEMKMEVKPTTYYLRSKLSSSKTDSAKNQVGVESSVAMFNQYIFTADAYGLVRCVDSDTMTTVWAVDTGDNVDAAVALDLDGEDTLSLYTGNTAYSRLGTKKTKPVTIRRLNAMTGDEIWQYTIQCTYDKDQTSGCKASPIIGQYGIEHLVIFTVNQVEGGKARVIALNKEDGTVAWSYDLENETVSSPVAVYNEKGDAWVIQADGKGKLSLLDGETGALRSTLDLDGDIQGSPAVYQDYMVIGTCSKDNSYMYAIQIK